MNTMKAHGKPRRNSCGRSPSEADRRLRFARCICLLLVLLLGAVTQSYAAPACGMPCCQTPKEHQQHCHEMEAPSGHEAEHCAPAASRTAALPERCCSLSSEEWPLVDQDRSSSQLPSLQPSTASVVVAIAEPPSLQEDEAPLWRASSGGRSRATFLCTYLL